MYAVNATDVRKEWGSFIDKVVRVKPQVIKRSRDYVFASSIELISDLLSAYTFKANIYREADGSFTATLDEIDIVVNDKSKEEAIDQLAADLMEYAQEFYEEYELYSKAPNRKSHLPYVFHVLMKQDIEEVKGLIQCPAGEN